MEHILEVIELAHKKIEAGEITKLELIFHEINKDDLKQLAKQQGLRLIPHKKWYFTFWNPHDRISVTIWSEACIEIEQVIKEL